MECRSKTRTRIRIGSLARRGLLQIKPCDPGYDFYKVPEHNARSLARALYQAIHKIETDTLSEPLVELAKDG